MAGALILQREGDEGKCGDQGYAVFPTVYGSFFVPLPQMEAHQWLHALGGACHGHEDQEY